MGFSGLARWLNAPSSGLSLIKENILLNHNGKLEGRWSLSVLSYRSTLSQVESSQFALMERSMCTLTMNENVFVLLEDPGAPNHTDVSNESHPPTHYLRTYLTLSPPGALEHLLKQLKARWAPVRQANNAQRSQQLLIEGQVFSIGSDWIVRVGHVTLPGGAIKGMLLEAEYLPLPVLHSPLADGTSELLSNLLTSILPNIPGAKTVAITISDAQWEEVLWDREEEAKRAKAVAEKGSDSDEGDIYVYGNEGIPDRQNGDWTGIERDRRSAFLIMGSLKSEGIL